jgi:hypothetical protein
MSNVLVAPGEPQFSIARSLSMTFGVFGRNFVPMMTIAVIVTAVQSLIDYVLSGGDVMGGGSSGGSFLNILSYGFITAPLTYATFQDLRGTRIGLSDMMSGGFKKIGRVMGAALAIGVVAVAVALPAVFLYFANEFLGIAVGIAAAIAVLYMFVAWFALVPVLVVEDVKFFAGFGRAAALSAGRRWGLLGLVLIYGVIIIGISLVIFGIIGFVALSAPLIGLVLTIPFLALYSVLGAIMPVVVYYLLRSEKEGVGIDEIAKVFD